MMPTPDLRAAVLDYVGGLADLDAGVVRAIGRAETRFEEDQSAHAARRCALRRGSDLSWNAETDARDARRWPRGFMP